MLQAILNRSWRKHPTKQQLYGHLPPITKTIQIRRTRHAGHCWRSRDKLISDVLLWTLHMLERKQDDQLEPTYRSSVRIRCVAQRTCRRRWTIGRGGDRGSGISMPMARHDDDDDDLLRTNTPKKGDCPVSWGCRIHWLPLCRGVWPPPPTSVLDMTLNNLMVRFQQCWNFGECGVPLHCHCSQVLSGPEW